MRARSLSIAPFSALILLTCVLPARAGDDDHYISVPALGAIWRLDAQSGALTPFVSGLGIPFYGAWSVTDGNLYMPDRALGIVFRITPQGVVTPFAAGGWLASPITVVQAPDGGLVVSDIFEETVVRLGLSGEQTLIFDAPGAGGLLSGPGGLAYGPDGTLYVANNISNTIAAIDEQQQTIGLVCSSPLISLPGGLAVDGAGNLFVANYGTSTIVRVRLDSGEAEIFCSDPFILSPNDVRLSNEGGLNVTMKNSALVRVNALGQITVIAQDTSLGEWDGVATPADSPPCGGAFLPYGSGLPGSGGELPELRGIFSPCPGAAVALEMRRFLGGAPGALAWGLSPASVPFKGGALLVNIGPPGGLIPLAYPGAGPGGGALRIPFTLPPDAILSGVSFYLQALAADPGAASGVSMSNGLQELIGN